MMTFNYIASFFLFELFYHSDIKLLFCCGINDCFSYKRQFVFIAFAVE